MLDMRFIRQYPDTVKQAVRSRKLDMDSEIERLLILDQKRREILHLADEAREEQNKLAKELSLRKKSGEAVEAAISTLRQFAQKTNGLLEEISRLEQAQQEILCRIPNVPHGTVPVEENSNPIEIGCWGEPREFPYPPLSFMEIAMELSILTGEGKTHAKGILTQPFRGSGARLERAVANLCLDTLGSRGYTEISPSCVQLGALPESTPKENDDGQGRVPDFPVNIHRGEILDGLHLPMSYAAYLPAMAGPMGERAVELARFTRPDSSDAELWRITDDIQRLLQLLELPYRTAVLPREMLAHYSAKTHEISVWMPASRCYTPLADCANAEAYQTRRAGIRMKPGPKAKAEPVHTVLGSMSAGSLVLAILENGQRDDGAVVMPKALIPYVGAETIR